MNLFGYIFIFLISKYVKGSLNETEIKESFYYLAEPLKKVLKSDNITKEVIAQHFNKSSDMLDMLLEYKKSFIKFLPGAFVEGIFSSIITELQKYEIESTEAFINNKTLRSNYTLYKSLYPKVPCSSSDMTKSLADIGSKFNEDNFDPLLIYYGLDSIENSLSNQDLHVKDEERLQKGLKNITLAFRQIDYILTTLDLHKSERETIGCMKHIKDTLQAIVQMHQYEEFLKKLISFDKKRGVSPVSSFSRITEEMYFEYFESIAPRIASFKLVGNDYGTILQELRK